MAEAGKASTAAQQSLKAECDQLKVRVTEQQQQQQQQRQLAVSQPIGSFSSVLDKRASDGTERSLRC